MEPEALALTLPIRRLVEFLLRTGSIDSRFTGFDRALEGARLHRKLQRAAVKEYPDYQAEVALKQDYACAQITYTLEGRADGIFTDTDGMPTIDEIKTHLTKVDGVMIGREAYHNPYILAEAMQLWGEPVPSRADIFYQLLDFLAASDARGTPLTVIMRHYLGLFQGLTGSRKWRQALSGQKSLSVAQVREAGEAVLALNAG